ncbi:MAG TPA: mannitol-1-phosphate 5-dehydrogenase [Clostridiaceae bacterium]|nr:mannitol-1-phosphate 5-dehydrogenase [Clostridiaceae bacterium]
MKALHFGSGNIGKGFIGYLLNRTGYEVCFVDVNPGMVDRLNEHHSYTIEILDDEHRREVVSPVSALNSRLQENEVLQAIVQADLVTTSVGVSNLPRIAPLIARGLGLRERAGGKKLDIIANENAINASSILKREIEKLVTPEGMERIRAFTGFPNSAIDRLALSRQSEEGEIALVEPFYEWVINRSEMVNACLPPIREVEYVDDLQPYIERKLFIVNMGHATAAYLGFLTGAPTIQKALERPEIENFVRKVMEESSRYIAGKYDISRDELERFVEKTIRRFRNQNISDDVLRVGRSPIRKLGYGERFITPVRMLFEGGYPTEYLTCAIAAGFLFSNPEDEESVRIQEDIETYGIEETVASFTGIEDRELRLRIIEDYQHLRKLYR